jgi:hypothetical protein
VTQNSPISLPQKFPAVCLLITHNMLRERERILRSNQASSLYGFHFGHTTLHMFICLRFWNENISLRRNTVLTLLFNCELKSAYVCIDEDLEDVSYFKFLVCDLCCVYDDDVNE